MADLLFESEQNNVTPEKRFALLFKLNWVNIFPCVRNRRGCAANSTQIATVSMTNEGIPDIVLQSIRLGYHTTIRQLTLSWDLIACMHQLLG